MKRKPAKTPAKQVQATPRKRKPKRYWDFHLTVTMEMQFSFDESEMLEDADGDVEISEEALAEKAMEIEEYLSQAFPVENVEILDDTCQSYLLDCGYEEEAPKKHAVAKKRRRIR